MGVKQTEKKMPSHLAVKLIVFSKPNWSDITSNLKIMILSIKSPQYVKKNIEWLFKLEIKREKEQVINYWTVKINLIYINNIVCDFQGGM